MFCAELVMVRRHVAFIVLALAVSWIAWLPLTAHALGWVDAEPSRYLHLLGGAGPAVAAVLLSAFEGRGSLRSLVRRCTSAPMRWIAVAVLAPLGLYLGAASVLLLLGFDVDLGATAQSTEYPRLGILTYVVANIAAYGFGEEIGWRGYLVPRLQQRASMIRASLIVAAVWAIWHLPLFAFAGMSAMGPAEVVGWAVSIVAGSLLMTALFNASGGSVLVVALFHGVLDVLINSPTGGPLQTTMGALVTIAGFTIPFRSQRARHRVVER
jgi:membrane protease YdiL (CAAX protease family)